MYFYGDDAYGAREAIEAWARQEKAALMWVDREQLEETSLVDIVAAGGGLFGKMVVVVRDPSSFPKSLQEEVAQVAEKPRGTFILWDRGAPDKRSKLWQTVKGQAREFGLLSAAQLREWLAEQVKQLGGDIELQAADLLIARLGSDRWRLLNEVRRLLLVTNPTVSPLVQPSPPFDPELMAEGKLRPASRGDLPAGPREAQGRSGDKGGVGLPAGRQGVGLITVELVEREVSAAAEAEIFAVLDALVRGEQERGVRSVETLLAMGQSEFYILSMLAYQWRVVMMVRRGLDEHKTAAQIAREGKLHPYVVEKTVPVAGRRMLNQWRDGLVRVLATDFAIKQGKVDQRTGLLMLVLTLAR